MAKFFTVTAKHRGFQGGLLLTDTKTGKGIGLWETEADATAFEKSGLFKELVAKFGDILVEPPAREQYKGSAGSMDWIR